MSSPYLCPVSISVVSSLMRKCIYSVLSVGPIPNHIAFIMDGNRRYAKKRNMAEKGGHSAGFSALMSVLRYCYELGVKHITVYAFSIDNFKRRPEQVESLMDLMLEKIEGLMEKESIVNSYGLRVHFVGNLKLLSEPVRDAAIRAMAATSNNSKAVLSICVAYSSTDEIVRAVQICCQQKAIQSDDDEVKGVEIEKHIESMEVAPEPDLLIRTSGENRLSNFLLWQTVHSYLYSPSVLWPDIGFRHIVWAVFNFQRNHSYLQKVRKQH